MPVPAQSPADDAKLSNFNEKCLWMDINNTQVGTVLSSDAANRTGTLLTVLALRDGNDQRGGSLGIDLELALNLWAHDRFLRYSPQHSLLGRGPQQGPSHSVRAKEYGGARRAPRAVYVRALCVMVNPTYLIFSTLLFEIVPPTLCFVP